jgi:hypothetical protein
MPRPARIAGIVFASLLGAILIGAIIATVWIGARGFLAYGHLREAQSQASAVRTQLSDPAAAAGAIDDIARETAAARSLTSDPVWAAAAGLPWIGPQLDAVARVAASVDQVAGDSLAPLADVASGFSVDALRPQGGRIDLTGFSAIREAATASTQSLGQAVARVDDIDRSVLVAPLRDAVDEVAALLDETSTTAGALSRASALLPAMLGADGPRNYLVLFQNNSEWRSLGGIPGAMVVIHTDGGGLSLAAQDSTTSFPRYDESVLPLDEEVLAIYGDRPGRWIQNVTQVPDFTQSAPLAREMWAREHDGQQVDGVIALDPVTLSYLLEATGPIELPTGDTLTAENAVPLLLNEVYQRYERPADQDAFFAVAAAAVFNALSQGSADPAALVAALTRAGDEQRLLLWSAHDEDQAILADTTLAGGLPPSDQDAATFGVFLNDGTGSKMDYYVQPQVGLQWTSCTPGAGRSATGDATLTVSLTSTAPADAANLPDYITGGGQYGVNPGVARTVVYAYLPEGFDLTAAELSNGGGFGGGTHEGRRVVSFTADVAPGETVTATISARTITPTAAELQVRSTPTIAPASMVAASCGDL